MDKYIEIDNDSSKMLLWRLDEDGEFELEVSEHGNNDVNIYFSINQAKQIVEFLNKYIKE